jgi:RNA polymerase sigma-70 factor (ECF subfamily)
MRDQRPRFTVDRERHRALLRSFSEAARGGDTARLIALLDDNVVLHTDGGGKAFATRKPVVGAKAVAQFIIAVARARAHHLSAVETDLNGAPGLVLTASGRPVLAILIDTDGERVHSVFAVANPDKLDAIAPLDPGPATPQC